MLRILVFTLAVACPALAIAGAIERTASTGVDATVEKFVGIVESKGATVFAVVDHGAGAEKIGAELPAAKLVIFGNPKIGTPLMQAAPGMGLDLPLRVLFHEMQDGSTRIVAPDLAVVAEAHGIAADHPALQKAIGALNGLTGAVAD